MEGKTDELLGWFLATTYRVDTPSGAVSIRLDSHSSSCAQAAGGVLRALECSSAVIVTAYNPMASPAPLCANIQAQRRLYRYAMATAGRALAGCNIPDIEDSPVEPTVVFPVPSAHHAQQLCLLWQQAAVVLLCQNTPPRFVWHPELHRC